MQMLLPILVTAIGILFIVVGTGGALLTHLRRKKKRSAHTTPTAT